ncbi:MAG: hypothetical protein JJT94_03380 [Bernardetiaceae bacterium]|nr:hypothetical protein [Bernardetiaceae bacterium]
MALFLSHELYAQEDVIPTDSSSVEDFKPSIQLGFFLQSHWRASQERLSVGSPSSDFNNQLYLYRARILLGAELSPRTSFFFQTELPQPVGLVGGDGNKNIQTVAPVILDAQIQYQFHKNFMMLGGMQLVGSSRQALQSPVTLLGLDFSYYQYAYNLFGFQALQNFFGRDIGVNARGFVLDERLEWRLGAFRGGSMMGNSQAPLRFVSRLNYNFLDKETFLYYSGTNLGKAKLLAIGGGADVQGSYRAFSADIFVDLPFGNRNAISGQLAFTQQTGGDPSQDFFLEIPNQQVLFFEAGLYLHKLRLQPCIKYEMQNIDANTEQFGFYNILGINDIAGFNRFESLNRLAFGLNFYPEEFGFHIKAQYERISYGNVSSLANLETVNRLSGGEFTLQLTFFMFQ